MRELSFRCLRVSAAVLGLALVAFLPACSPLARETHPNTVVNLSRLRNLALSWHPVPYADALAGMRILADGPPTASATLAIVRAILRTNARIGPLDALRLGAATVRAARRDGLLPEYLAATLLQESAYDPRALSSAGAVGIAQFMPGTAAENGVDPYDPYDAIRGAAALISFYVRSYRGVYPDPYAAALAAYNAGPGAVDAYHGIPPYPQTREYVGDILERWAWIAAQERTRAARQGAPAGGE